MLLGWRPLLLGWRPLLFDMSLFRNMVGGLLALCVPSQAGQQGHTCRVRCTQYFLLERAHNFKHVYTTRCINASWIFTLFFPSDLKVQQVPNNGCSLLQVVRCQLVVPIARSIIGNDEWG